MKVTNHKKGNYTYDDSEESSVMYGTITMTEKEWKDAIAYLRKEWKRAICTCNTGRRDGLAHLFEWTLPKHENEKRICIGVTGTIMLFNHYGLPRYKKQNYVIERI